MELNFYKFERQELAEHVHVNFIYSSIFTKNLSKALYDKKKLGKGTASEREKSSEYSLLQSDNGVYAHRCHLVIINCKRE